MAIRELNGSTVVPWSTKTVLATAALRPWRRAVCLLMSPCEETGSLFVNCCNIVRDFRTMAG